MRHGNERYILNEMFQTIFEDKQVTAAAHFRFQCQFLTNKITKFVDDFLKGGSHMRPGTNFVLALHGECLRSNTYKNAFICFEKTFLGLRIVP